MFRSDPNTGSSVDPGSNRAVDRLRGPGLKTKIWLSVGLTLLLGFVPLLTYQYRSIRTESVRDALSEARTLAVVLKVSSEFFYRTLLENGVRLTDGRINLLPVHTMVRLAEELPAMAHLGRLQLRFVSFDHPDGAYPVGPTDQSALDYFIQHPGALEFQTESRTPDGERQFYYAQPIWTQPTCLMCHGAAERVPDWVKARNDVSLGHLEGDLRAILALRLSSSLIDQRVRKLFLGSLVIGALVFVLLALVLSVLIQHLVLNRLADLQHQIGRVTAGDYRAQVGVAGGDEVTHLADAFNEMAERVNAREREILESQGKLKLLIEHAPAALAMFDRHGRALAVSRRWMSDRGLTDQPAAGRGYAELSPGIPREWTSLLRRALSGEVIEREQEVLAEGRGAQWLHWEIHPWYQSSGDIGGVVTFTEDLTAHKAAEAVLTRANRYHRNLLEASLDALVVIDRQGSISDVNSAMERFAGVTREELLGTEFAGYFSAPEQARKGCERAFLDGTIRDFPLELRHRDGWTTSVLYNASVCRSGDDSNVLFAAARDVTALQKITELLEARVRLLEDLENRSLDEVMLACLNKAAALTGSRTAFYQAHVPYHGTSRFQTWANPGLRGLCQDAAVSLHAVLLQSGVWLGCVNTHKPIVNQSDTEPNLNAGLAPRLPGMTREMIVPVIRSKRVVAILGVGIKPHDYDECDLRVATTLADLAWDLVQRKYAAEQLSASETRYRRIVETALEGVWIIDQDFRTSFVNARMAAMLRLEPGRILGSRVEDFLFEEDVSGYHQRLESRASGASEQYEQRLRRSDGSTCWVLVSAVPILDEEQQFNGVLRMLTDIGPLKAQQQRLEHMAHFDALTGLPNRVLFADRLLMAMAMARRERQLLAVCYFDLDDFKPVNDTYGHAAGDLLLAQLATQVTRDLRGGDTMARIGGDEFILLLGGLSSEDQARRMLERVQAIVSEPFAIDNTTSVHVSASIGYTLYPLDSSDHDELMHHADLAMYQAKQAGRHCIRRFVS